MPGPLEGITVVEVAMWGFVPSAGGVLADWGADVIKIEHPQRGDTQRGFVNMGGFALDPDRHPLIEHPNRGKRSVGIDVSTPGGQEMLYEIAKTADVFLTNYLPGQRQGSGPGNGRVRRHRLLDAQWSRARPDSR